MGTFTVVRLSRHLRVTGDCGHFHYTMAKAKQCAQGRTCRLMGILHNESGFLLLPVKTRKAS